MKTKKVAKIVIIILFIVIFIPPILFVSYLGIVFAIPIVFSITAPEPDIPEIRHAEFPYEIVYKTNGEMCTTSGIYVCKYDGIETASARTLTWESYVKNTDVKKPRDDQDIPLFVTDGIEVYLEIGEPGYYMDDPNIQPPDKPKLVCRTNSKIYFEWYNDDFRQVCDVELISYTLPEPIENTFVPKKWYEFWK